MGCAGCSCSTGKDSVSGCRSNGGCATGGCNRKNTYDWISALGISDPKPFDIVEVSFKNGARKDFFKNPPQAKVSTGDYVLVEAAGGGFDVGKISLSGELVRLQMKRKRVKPDARLLSVIRKAHDRDLERLDEVRAKERDVMIRARAISRSLSLNMKVGDVEYQGDGRKCTFYYTADGRVDFRELIRHYAKAFNIKIEMRQIGARQESARLGGIGNCGRELCCSTWINDFKSVNTAAARYQNLAINQTKLSGMCGRLKCCLNYELDTYIDALEDFPDKADKLRTEAGRAILIKTDVFKRLMYYTYEKDRGKLYQFHVDQVWEALEMIKSGKLPGSLDDIQSMAPPPDVEEVVEETPDFESVHNVIQLPIEKRKKKKKRKKNHRGESLAAAVEKAEREESVSQPAGNKGGTGAKTQQKDRPRDNRPAKKGDASKRQGGQDARAVHSKGEKSGAPHPQNNPAPKQEKPANKPLPPAPPTGNGDDPAAQVRKKKKRRNKGKGPKTDNSGGAPPGPPPTS